MNFSLAYLANRFFCRLFDFFHHWYADGSRVFFNYFISRLERMDQTFAVRVTLRYFFQPLYKDYTIVGRILGVVFRSARLLIGAAVYLAAALVFAACYLIWLSVPILLIFSAVR